MMMRGRERTCRHHQLIIIINNRRNPKIFGTGALGFSLGYMKAECFRAGGVQLAVRELKINLEHGN